MSTRYVRISTAILTGFVLLSGIAASPASAHWSGSDSSHRDRDYHRHYSSDSDHRDRDSNRNSDRDRSY